MSRLYIRAQGESRRIVTRCGRDSAFTEILFNFDGGSSADGGLRLDAVVSPDHKTVAFCLAFKDGRNGNQRRLGTWVIRADDPQKILDWDIDR